jgi:hypothetical protein
MFIVLLQLQEQVNYNLAVYQENSQGSASGNIYPSAILILQ